MHIYTITTQQSLTKYNKLIIPQKYQKNGFQKSFFGDIFDQRDLINHSPKLFSKDSVFLINSR